MRYPIGRGMRYEKSMQGNLALTRMDVGIGDKTPRLGPPALFIQHGRQSMPSFLPISVASLSGNPAIVEHLICPLDRRLCVLIFR